MERERWDRTTPRVLGLPKSYSKKELSLPEHGQYQKIAQVGVTWGKGERGFVVKWVWKRTRHICKGKERL